MSLDIPAGIILLWPGSNGSIPSGFSRNTDFDSKFGVGASNGANGGGTGGGTSHSHSTTHNHGSGGHSHTSTTPADVTNNDNGQNYNPAGTKTSAHENHHHTWTSSSSSPSYSGGGGFGSGNQTPSYYDMIYIESNGSATTYPDNCVVMRNDANGVSGWTQHSGSKSRYIRGAGSGGNGGGTGGGGHTHSLGSHSHSFPSHTHYTTNNSSGANAASAPHGLGIADAYVEPTSHYHKFRISSSSGGGSSGTAGSITSSSTTLTPVYHYLWGLENTSGGEEAEGMIVLWDGTVGNIPDDWLLCDGSNSTPDLRDKFLRMANSSGEVGGTGGSNGHSHGGGSHSHSAPPAHNHPIAAGASRSWPVRAEPWEPYGQWGSGYGGTNHPSYHSTGSSSFWNVDNASVGMPSTSASNNTNSDTRPTYRTVLYLYSPEGESAAGGNVGMFGANF